MSGAPERDGAERDAVPASHEPPSGDAGAPPAPDAPSASADDEVDAPRVLLLALGATTWAVPAERVRGVVRPVAVTPAPGAPAWALGVAAVRGAVLPVLDLAARAGVEAETGRDAWWVIVEEGVRAAALAGARVRSVEPAALAALEAVAGDDARRGGLPLAGVARLVEQGSGGPSAPRASVDGVAASGAAAAPVAGDVPPPPPIPVLDVAAVLDELLHDEGG